MDWKFGSRRWSLDFEDVLAIAKGTGIAAAGAVLTYLATDAVAMLRESDDSVKLALAAALSVGVNIVRKWMEDNRI